MKNKIVCFFANFALFIALTSSAGCLIVYIDEPVMPESML